MINYKGLRIESCDRVYAPAEDTILLADNLKTNKNDIVLEIGTGTGLVALAASLNSKKVLATDINPHAVECAQKNLQRNRIENMNVIQGDLFQPLKNEKFDLILFNTPYLPSCEEEILDDYIDAAWNGGEDGRRVIDLFLDEVKHFLNKKGRVQLVQSSLSDIKKTINKMETIGFEVEISAFDKFFFEKVVVISGKLK